MATLVKFLGISDETNTCDCCGKTGLKRVVVLDIDGIVVNYGTNCAAKALANKGIKTDKKSVESIAEVYAYFSKYAGNVAIDRIAQGIWNKFGYRFEVKNNVILIHTGIGVLSLVK